MTNRIAGLSIQARPHHAMVVLVHEGGVWRVESATTRAGDVVSVFANPGCPVIVDAAAFWQHSEHSRQSAPDAEQLLAAGWDVRGPVMKGDKPKNPERAAMQAHLDEMMDSGRLTPSLMLVYGVVEALHLAAWGTREPAADGEQATPAVQRALRPWIEAAKGIRTLTELLPHQRLVADALTTWLATDAPIAIVTGDRRSGKAFTVGAWAKATGLRLEEVRPSYVNSDEGMDECKQGPRDLTVFFEAEKVPRQMVVDAVYTGRVVLVANPPACAEGDWIYDLIEGIREGRLAGVVIECRAPRVALSPAVAKLVQVIDPAGAA